LDRLAFRLARASDLPALLGLLVDDEIAQARGGYAASHVGMKKSL